MTTALREAIGLSLANLHEISKHFNEADTAEARRHALAYACSESEQALVKAQAALKASQDDLRNLQGQLAAKRRIIEDQQNRSNAELDQRIASAQGEWAGLDDKIRKARAEIERLDGSLGSLYRRLHIG